MTGPVAAARRLARPPADTPPLYAQDGLGFGAIVFAHYFGGSNDWWITEYSPAEDEAFGFARIGGDDLNAELGYVPLGELDGLTYPVMAVRSGARSVAVSLPIEYDEHWTRVSLQTALAAAGIHRG